MHLSEIAARRPDQPAVIEARTGATTTYRDLDRRSRQVSRFLAGHGIGTGDHVAILMDNRAEYLEIFWGAQRRGVFTTPVNWHLTVAEAAYVVRDCGARILFVSDTLGELGPQVAAACPGVTVVWVGKDAHAGISYADILGGPAYGDDGRTEAVADGTVEVEGSYFLYSSGTTGQPKGIEPVHDFPPFGTGLPIDHVMRDSFGFDADTVYLCPAPLYHSAPLGWSLGTHRNEGRVVLMDRFDPLECLAAIEQYQITHAQFVPTMFVRMLKLAPEQRAAYDLSSLQVVVHAAAPCPVDVKQQMIEWLGPILLEFYAGSEGIGMTMITSEDWLSHRGSVGQAIRGRLHIVSADGTELAAHEVGTVYFADGGAFQYHNDPAKTAGAFDERGWATIGDMGSVDEDGYLYLADRRADLILSGGVNIYPREIEDALVLHPAVADVAVIGVPDPEMGQRVRAVVQLAPGRIGDAATTAELEEHCRDRIAAFKRPREWHFVEQLPRTEAGKLVRRRLRPS